MFTRLIALLVGLVMATFTFSAPSQAATGTVNYAGSDSPQQTFDYWPAPGSHRPWMVTIHGGSWVHGAAGDPAMVLMRNEMNSLGVTVFDLNYRLGSSRVHFADQKADLDAALAYIRSHASDYKIDPNRGIIYGHSAGGHLAAVLGLEGNGDRGIRGIITTSGVLAPHWTLHPGVRPTQGNLTLYAYETMLAGIPGPRWHSYLPQSYLSPNDPPILAFQGTADPVVPPIEASVLKSWANARGVQMTVVYDKGYGHTYLQLWHTPSSLAKMVSFVKDRLGV